MKKNPTAKKATAATTETAKAPAPVANTVAALGLCVLVTLPPAWKLESPDARPYWQIEVKDQQGRRYSDVYRVKELEKAHDLAERIAKDRKLPIVTQEPPAPKQAAPVEPVPMPDPDEEDGEASPF